MGRELKAKVVAAGNGDASDDESANKKDETLTKKKSIHDLLKDAAQEAEKESKQKVGAALLDSFLDDTDAQKVTLAQMRAKKRQEAAQIRSISANLAGSATKDQPLFDETETWEEQNEQEKADKKKAKKQRHKKEKSRKGTIGVTSYVRKDYDPKAEARKAENGEDNFDSKVDKAVEAAGVHAEEKRQKEIEIDPSKFLELNTHDLTQVSADFVDKMDQFDEEAANSQSSGRRSEELATEKALERLSDISLRHDEWFRRRQQ
uniref:Uncharacterized protein n=1 Tax=Caenorhabditis japonica TaxID=281687 RepID=A0A8R1IYD0_CAEJA